MSGLTHDDLREAVRDMTDTMRVGFDGMNDRLDILNGRVRKGEETAARHEERFAHIAETCRDRHAKLPMTLPADAGVTKDWKVLAGIGVIVAGAVSGLLQGAWAILEIMQKAAGKP